MNVLAKIGYDNLTVEIEFPIDDDELDRTLKQNYMPTDTTKPFLVRNIDYPTILSELTGRTVNLDELNYLAKRLNCFDDDEMDQFEIAVEQENMSSLKDLINLSFNLDKFTLIKDISDMTKVGREYVLNTEGSVLTLSMMKNMPKSAWNCSSQDAVCLHKKGSCSERINRLKNFMTVRCFRTLPTMRPL